MRHCIRQCVISNIANKLLGGREDVVKSVLKNDMGRKIKSKVQR